LGSSAPAKIREKGEKRAKNMGLVFLKKIIMRCSLGFYFEEFRNSVGGLFLEFFFYVHAVRFV
jgi:hypothetical protein